MFQNEYEGRTIALNHERLDDIVADQLKVGMADPVTKTGLGAREEVVEDSDLMAEQHETIDQMRTDKAGPSGDEDTFAVRGGEKLDRGEAGKGGVGDGLRVRVEDGLGLIRSMPLSEPCVLFLGLGVYLASIGVGRGDDIVGAEVQRADDFQWDLAVKPEALETDRGDLLAVLIDGTDLREKRFVSEQSVALLSRRRNHERADNRPRKARKRVRGMLTASTLADVILNGASKMGATDEEGRILFIYFRRFDSVKLFSDLRRAIPHDPTPIRISISSFPLFTAHASRSKINGENTPRSPPRPDRRRRGSRKIRSSLAARETPQIATEWS